jgi:uncharacterized protein
MINEQLDTLPWYKQFWPWFLISIPAATVVAGIITIQLAIDSFDGMVVDDYYKHGMAINQQKKRDLYASNHQINGEIKIDNENQIVHLNLHSSEALPPELTLNIRYAVLAGFDQLITLKKTALSKYAGTLETPLKKGKWIVQVETEKWRIQSIFLSTELDQPISLIPSI